MRTKDRLAELRHLAEGVGAGVYRDTVEVHTQPPPQLAQDVQQMFQEVERMRGWIHELNGNTQLLRRLHADPTFHTNKHLQDQLEAVITASGNVGLKVCGALRQFEGVAARSKRNDAAARIARLQYAATRALYADALAAHHAALTAVRDQQRDLLHEQIKLTNLTISDEECESLLETRNLSLFVDNVKAETTEARRMLREVEARHEELARIEASLRDVRDLFTQLAVLVAAQVEAETAEARRMLREVEARHEELARIEASLRDVRDLFTQLAVLIAAQQEQVDSVEYYALQATEHVECGGQQLLKGTISKTKTRKKKMSLIICLVVGAFVVLLVLIYT